MFFFLKTKTTSLICVILNQFQNKKLNTFLFKIKLRNGYKISKRCFKKVVIQVLKWIFSKIYIHM